MFENNVNSISAAYSINSEISNTETTAPDFWNPHVVTIVSYYYTAVIKAF